MAKAPATAASPAAPKRATVRVTYRPIEHINYRINEKGERVPNGISYDLPVITWNKIKFEANVPAELDPKNKAHGYEVPMPKEYAGPDGEVRTKHRETWVSMIDLAKDNPSFEVEGFPRAKVKKSKRVLPPAGHEWADTHEDEIYEEAEAA
jgi:hypothetical protein